MRRDCEKERTKTMGKMHNYLMDADIKGNGACIWATT
jgi:hypothetical protein